ncbi:unnamed protein product [Knipowitschia caucasica]|uniref:Uncharacterized protein n=1 Tax=Knipowitschia caucasica TaxID=637954 RepID=A0AAV2L5J2_KNICA
MGASLDTPATCPLCNELTREPVTLKCQHRFCQRCIGDLWSVVPNGPYHCPEWRCKTVYHTLPFDKNLIRQKANQSPRPPPSSSAGTTKNNEQTTISSSALGRPCLQSRLLGKRKASAPVTDVSDPKRSSLAQKKKSNDTETPSTSLSGESVLETADKTRDQNPLPFTSAMESSASSENENGAAKCKQDVPSVVERKAEEVMSLDQSDNEVDICDAPLLASPKTIPQEQPTPKKAPAPPSPPRVMESPKQADPSPARSRPTVFSAHRVSPSDSSSKYTSLTPQSESKKNKQIACNYCPKLAYEFAVKTCLVCGASMCTEHLRPHLDQPVFQNHTLVSPVEDTSPWRCQEHQEMNRIYCRQCGLCVCTVCTVIGSHRDHVCISIREAERELRGNLKEQIKILQDVEQQVMKSVCELTHKKECFEMIFTEAHGGVKQQYGAIREALEQEEQMALQCVAQEEKRLLGGLETKLGHLQSSLQSVQQGLHTLEGLADAKGDQRVQDQAFIMEYGKVAQIASSVGSCAEHFEAPEEINQAKLQCLQKWTEKRLDEAVITVPGKDRDLCRLLYGTSPVMNEDSAHPKLHLSEDKRTVLALTGLDRGRWYWEVDVSTDDGRWKVGVTEQRIERKGQKDGARLGFNCYSWCLACDRKKVEALHNKVGIPVDADELERVGIFLDFEEGTLSFFNVTPGGSLVLMHSYKQQFSDPVYPAFSVSKTNISVADLFRS